MNELNSENSNQNEDLSIDDKNAIEFVKILTQLELSAELNARNSKRPLSDSLRYSASKIASRVDQPILKKILNQIYSHPNPKICIQVWRARLEEAAGGRVHW